LKYAKGVKRTKAERKRVEERLRRKPGLERGAIEIPPPPPDETRVPKPSGYFAGTTAMEPVSEM
jgi:hypothetical protein